MANNASSLPPFLAEPRRSLGARVRERRHALRLRQKELAAKAEVNPTRLSRIEHGEVTPHLFDLLGLGRALELGMDELVHGKAPEKPAMPAVSMASLSARLHDLLALGTAEEAAAFVRLLDLLAYGCRARRAAQGSEA